MSGSQLKIYFSIGSAGVLAVVVTAASLERNGQSVEQRCSACERAGTEYPTVTRLAAMSDAELAAIDPVVMSLIVAKGVPELADLEIERYVKELDDWAAVVRKDVVRHRYRFEEDPGAFGHSEADYKISWLATDINAVFKVDYDLNEFDASDPSNLFLSGIVDRRRGTCVSMPMLYVALGWRLGYPIRLVQVPTHVFARWDDGRERINIETTGYGASYPDSHYAEAFFVSERCRNAGGELASMGGRQMLAMLLLARASFWSSAGNADREFKDVVRAYLLDPKNPLAVARIGESWQALWRTDEYVRHSVTHLADAGEQIAQRTASNRRKPLERSVAGPDGAPMRVEVEPNTQDSRAERE